MSMLKRAMRLVELRARATDLAKSALAGAEAKVRREAESVEQAEIAWKQAAEEANPRTIGDAIDEEALLEHLTLQRRVAEQALLTASQEREACRLEAVVAQRDLRKLEKWADGMRSRAAHESSKAEQKVLDETAARRAKR